MTIPWGSQGRGANGPILQMRSLSAERLGSLQQGHGRRKLEIRSLGKACSAPPTLSLSACNFVVFIDPSVPEKVK